MSVRIPWSRPELAHDAVRRAYSRAAAQPDATHPFPLGRGFACSLGYPVELLSDCPPPCVDAFTGVSNVTMIADIPPGATVLDAGCGAGMDAWIAARAAGPLGRVIGVDFSQAMLTRARASLRDAYPLMLFCLAAADALPIAGASIDVAVTNGLFNLNPDRDAIFRELARVVRPGGVLHAAELILKEPLPATEPVDERAWFA
ncbi:MAG: methyltransferase domain-containing protein [Acidobacteriota bacterium]